MKRYLIFAVAVCVSVAVSAASAQKSFSIGSPSTENFDSLGTGSVVLVNNTTIQGVYATRTTGNVPAGNTAPAYNGSTSTGQIYNMGSTGSADRALGTVSTTASGTNFLGVRLVNSGATTIGSITVQYTGETWRQGNGAAETLTFEYQTGATVTDLTTGTWTPVAALNYTNPNNPPGQGPLDGNLALNRTVVSATFAVAIPAGTEIMLRWSDIVDSAQPDGLAIDDLTVTAIGPSAGDATISGRVTDAYGRAISSAAISVQDLAGNRKVVYTNTFGYYSVKGLDVGQAYVLGVSARRYTFANPSMVIDLSDNFSGANFVALR